MHTSFSLPYISWHIRSSVRVLLVIVAVCKLRSSYSIVEICRSQSAFRAASRCVDTSNFVYCAFRSNARRVKSTRVLLIRVQSILCSLFGIWRGNANCDLQYCTLNKAQHNIYFLVLGRGPRGPARSRLRDRSLHPRTCRSACCALLHWRDVRRRRRRLQRRRRGRGLLLLQLLFLFTPLTIDKCSSRLFWFTQCR